MKFEIDSSEKTVRLLSDAPFSEMISALETLLGDTLHEYTVLGTHGYVTFPRPAIVERKPWWMYEPNRITCSDITISPDCTTTIQMVKPDN